MRQRGDAHLRIIFDNLKLRIFIKDFRLPSPPSQICKTLAVIVPKLTTELKLTKFIDKYKEMENKKLDIKLRPTEIEDLDTLFLFQTDTEGGYLAAFMSKDPTDKTAYIDKWS